MSIVRTRTLVIYIMILSFFSLFVNMAIENNEEIVEDTHSKTIRTVTNDLTSFYDEDVSTLQKWGTAISLIWKVPIAIMKVMIGLISIPFQAIPHIPSLIAIFLYVPFVVILFFDVILPLLLKLWDIIGDYIPFT